MDEFSHFAALLQMAELSHFAALLQMVEFSISLRCGEMAAEFSHLEQRMEMAGTLRHFGT